MPSEYIPPQQYKKVKRAVYAGSFDPITNGHLWVIETALSMFDELIVAIGENPDKRYTFSLDDRLYMLNESVSAFNKPDNWTYELDGNPVQIYSPKIRVDSFQNKFLSDYAAEQKADFIVRGVRNSQDFEFERTLQNVNIEINPHPITTILLAPPKRLSEVSSSIVKSLCGPQNWEQIVSKMVPPCVFSKLKEWKNDRIANTKCAC